VSAAPAARGIGPESLSAALLALYREADHSAPGVLRERALERMRALLPFDAALWADGYLLGDRLHVYNALAAGPKRAALKDHGALRHADPALAAAQRAPGAAVAVELRGDGTAPEFAAFARRRRLRHAAAVLYLDPLTSLASAIVLYRLAGATRFRDGEREYLEALAPHLVETRGIAAIQALLRATGARGAQLSSSGVADAAAQLQVAPADFQRLLRLEWPAWSGRALPAPLAELVRERAGWRYAGERIVVRVSTMGDVYLLQPREKRLADALSAREYEVARLMAEGHTYKEAASRLGISPATVRSHLRAIFATLGVNKQSEMAAALREQP
jgi:DNA-binding CsgD family transcriptional regulator